MKASGQYIVTIEYHDEKVVLGYSEIALEFEEITAKELLKELKELIKLPENATHYQITGIYKL